MRVRLKPLDEQVIVITGASSGIGLVTAKMAAKRGARVVLAAHNGEALARAVQTIRGEGGEAMHIVTDVSREQDVRRVAEAAITTYGGFDTWFNNAGATMFGRIEEVSEDDVRRLFDINFWGVVYGSRVPANHLKQRGGALLNMGSVLAERAVPLQGMYAATKHAVKALTDALRMELEADGAPVSVTLITPGAIDTPFAEHGRNYQAREARLPPPVYAPELVAEAALHCASHPKRDMIIGGGAKAASYLAARAPRLLDKVMAADTIHQQHTDTPERHPERHILYQPSLAGGRERGSYPYWTLERSLYTKAVEHPLAASLTGAALTAAAALWCATRNGTRK